MNQDAVDPPAQRIDVRAVLTAATIAVVVAAGASQLVPVVLHRNLTSWIFLGLAGAGLWIRVRQQVSSSRAHSLLAVPTTVEWGVLLLLAGGLGAVAFNGTQAANGLLRMIQHATILVAVTSLPPTWRSMRLVLAGLLAGVGVQVSVALLELLIGRTFLYSLWKPLEAATWNGFQRIASTPADPNYLALGLVSTIPLVIVASRIWPTLGIKVVGALTAAWLLSIAFTFSRAGYLTLALMAPIALSITGNWRRARSNLERAARRSLLRPGVPLLTLLALLGVLTIVVMPGGPVAAFFTRLGSLTSLGGDASLNVRLAAQLAAVMVFFDHPLFGIGYDRFVEVGAAYFNAISGQAWHEINVLNSFLLVASEGGVLALAGFIGATVAAVRALIRGAHKASTGSRPVRAEVVALQALAVGLVAWSVMSLTLDAVHSPIQWVFLGLGGLVARAGWRGTDNG